MGWQVWITEADHAALAGHLHREDGEEHAAFCYAGVNGRGNERRLLVRRIVPVPDSDFPPGRGRRYRQITPRAVAHAAVECDAEGLCLIWVHNHPQSDTAVKLSLQDRRTAARVHPVLADLTDGRPVTALVLGTGSAAGEVWTREGIEPVRGMRVIGSAITDLYPSPLPGGECDERFARQVLLFGETGQRRLRDLTAAVVGLGGGGSLIAQTLAHLGVGRIILIDHDIVKRLNLSRIVGATPADIDRLKVDIVARLVRSIDPAIKIRAFNGDVTYVADALETTVADVIFLATDTAFARHAVNLICHQYLIPFFQVGAKVSTSATDGGVTQIHITDRPFSFTSGCMHCAGIIPPGQLQREQQDEETNRVQDYLGAGGYDIEDPSVITFNSIAVSLATTDFLLAVTGLAAAPESGALVVYPLERAMRSRSTPALSGCPYCDPAARLSARARGDTWPLQLRPGHSPAFAERPVPAPDRCARPETSRAGAAPHVREPSRPVCDHSGMRIRLAGGKPLHDPATGSALCGTERVILDATEMVFASPLDLAGIAAWATWLRHQGYPVEFVLPSDADISRYLTRMDLVHQLASAGVTISGTSPSIRRADRTDVLLEVRHVHDPETVDRFTEDAYQLAMLHTTTSSARAAARIIAELLDNAITHASSPVGAYAAAQARQRVGNLELAVADAGIGIRSHLARNPNFRDLTAVQAIRAALRPGVSGTPEPRGNGLPDLLNTASGFGGQMLLRSDDGYAKVTSAPTGRRITVASQVTGTWAWIHVRLPPPHQRMVSLQQ